MLKSVRDFIKHEEGVAMSEYGIFLVLVAVAGILVITMLGVSFKTVFTILGIN